MSEVFGFVAEPHKNNYYLVSPATQEDNKITCHDLSGFLGSWVMKKGGKFFPTVSGDTLCKEAMRMAIDFASKNNASIEDF